MTSKGFILPDGEVVDQGGKRHDTIVLEYLISHPELRKKFDSTGGSLCDFMVFNMGAIKVGSNSGDPRVITYKSKKRLSRETRFYIEYYTNKGYRVDVVWN